MNSFYKFSKEKQMNNLIKQLEKSDPIQTNCILSTRSNFKPYDQSGKSIKIMNGTFYRQDSEQKRSGQSKIKSNEQVRYLDSATTNMDTPFFDAESTNEKIQKKSSKSNTKLKKFYHLKKYRKRKIQKYLIRKKKNNYILKGKGSKNDFRNQECRKRIKYPLFQSLHSHQNDPQTLKILIQNMKKVAFDSVYCADKFLIKHPYPKHSQNEAKNMPKNNFFSKKKLKKQSSPQEIQRQKLMKRYSVQLLKIASEIEKQYEPEFDSEKICKQQKSIKKQEHQNCDDESCHLHKDNEEIKTIIDNSEDGLFSQGEKQSINHNAPEKLFQKICSQYNNIDQMNYAQNRIQDSDDTS